MRQNIEFKDIQPEDIWQWKHIENIIHNTMDLYNFYEIRPSIIQPTNLLNHTYKTTDMQYNQTSELEIVYNLDSDYAISLRPEGTLAVLRNKLCNSNSKNNRLYYIGPMFQKETSSEVKRIQFHQFGAEYIGSESPLADIEVIMLGLEAFKNLGLIDAHVEVNSFGCEKCRKDYFDKLSNFIENSDNMECSECKIFVEKSSDRAIECVKKSCSNFTASVPTILENLCSSCRSHFDLIDKSLSNLMINYEVNPFLRRNFNYYSRTVFNFVKNQNGKKIILGGGGRYDSLASNVIGKKTGAVGFSSNLDYLLDFLKENHLLHAPSAPFTVMIAAESNDLNTMALQILHELHENKLHAILDSKSLTKAEMIDNAKKEKCNALIVLQNENVRSGKALMINIRKDYEESIFLDEIIEDLQVMKKSITI